LKEKQTEKEKKGTERGGFSWNLAGRKGTSKEKDHWARGEPDKTFSTRGVPRKDTRKENGDRAEKMEDQLDTRTPGPGSGPSWTTAKKVNLKTSRRGKGYRGVLPRGGCFCQPIGLPLAGEGRR